MVQLDSFFLSLFFFKACGLFSRETKQTDELPRQVSQQQTNKTFLKKKKKKSSLLWSALHSHHNSVNIRRTETL